MSYNVINDGRPRSAGGNTIPTDALAATRFLDDRKAAELPVPTAEQVKRAQRLVAGNPTIRQRNSPLGLQQLALGIPLTRREREKNRLAPDEGGIGLTLEPVRVRTGTAAEIEASLEAVQAMVDAHPHLDGRGVAELIAQRAGYVNLTYAVQRAERYGRSTGKTRIVGHMRSKLLVLSAMAQAIKLCEERDAAAAASSESE